ncbi:MAG: hypothetical protein ACI32N_01310 [Bulleidia sp.]
MDVENSRKGMDFHELPDTYVIFITEKDYYGKNQPIYKIERMVLNDNVSFEERSHILYINGQYRDDTEIGKLMHDFNCANPDDMLIPILAERTRYLKTNEVEVEHMCEQMEKLKNIGKAEGIVEGVSIGEYNTKKAAAIKMYKKGQDPEDIADTLEISVSLVNEWIDAKK